MREMAEIYARKLFQEKFKYQTVFSGRLFKLVEDDQVLDEIEKKIILNYN